MSSSVIQNGTQNPKISEMAIALTKMQEQIDTEVQGQYGQTVIIQSGNAVIRNSELDCEFTVNFDDNTEADEAEVTIYNLSNSTINKFVNGATITITAGYGSDTGIIFSGAITSKRSVFEGLDRVTTIRAIDDIKRKNKEVESISYAAGTKASYILKDLCEKVGLPIAVFNIVRDYDYTDQVTVNGNLSEAIKQYAKVCGVSAYACKSKIYVRSLNDGDNTRFVLSTDTGLLSVSEFEEETTSEEYTDVIKGFDVEMLLQHRLQTASIIQLDSKNYKGIFRVREGSHTYSGSDFKTKAKIIAYSPIQQGAISEQRTPTATKQTNRIVLKDASGYILQDSTGAILTEGVV